MTKDVTKSADAFETEVAAGHGHHAELFNTIPERLTKRIFSFLDGENLANVREVCQKWNELTSEDHLWKSLCLKKWKSLETDVHLWPLISHTIPLDGPNRWRQIYRLVRGSQQWNCRLEKSGKFICNFIPRQISGAPVDGNGLPNVLDMKRRFDIVHLESFIVPDAAVLYFEPEQESDRTGFNDFIEYLNRRSRAGLGVDGNLRFVFIPPCEYTRTRLDYHGQSLLGVVQNAFPPPSP